MYTTEHHTVDKSNRLGSHLQCNRFGSLALAKTTRMFCRVKSKAEQQNSHACLLAHGRYAARAKKYAAVMCCRNPACESSPMHALADQGITIRQMVIQSTMPAS